MTNVTAPDLTLESPIEHTGPTFEVVTVTPVIAEEWLGKNTGNRNVRDAKVRMLAADMRDGNWLLTGEAIKFDWRGRLIDGQHRLLAIIEAGVSVRILVARGLVPEAQLVLDTGAKRSAADALRMAGEHSNHVVIAAAIRILASFESGQLRTTASRPAEMSNAQILDWYRGREEALAAAAIAARRVCKVTGAMASVVVAFTYLASQVDPEAALRFLDDIENMRTNGKGDPRYTLIIRLQRIRDWGERTSQAQQLYYFLRAWNAWRAKTPLHGMKDTTAKGPALIRGPM